MKVYYNEIDPFCVKWLRELMEAGAIPEGIIDDRSIEDVKPKELEQYDQCHFFAGIGVWAYALKQAGWGDRPVWTGSCPCQPFSAAGKSGGFSDERHLWPAFHHLIRNVRPVTVFGEQVASKDGLTWLDLVQTDMEGEGYAFGAVDTCAAGFGAPHIRQRLYWMGQSNGTGREQGRKTTKTSRHGDSIIPTSDPGSVAIPTGKQEQSTATGRLHAKSGECSNMGNTTEREFGSLDRESGQSDGREITVRGSGIPGPTNGFWRDCEWLPCRDNKARAVESGTFPLVDGTPNRVGRLRGFGNAIVAPQAEEFVRAYMNDGREGLV